MSTTDEAPSKGHSGILWKIGLGAIIIIVATYACSPDPSHLFPGRGIAFAWLTLVALGGVLAVSRILIDGWLGRQDVPPSLSGPAAAWLIARMSLLLAVLLWSAGFICAALVNLSPGERFYDGGFALFMVWLTIISVANLIWAVRRAHPRLR